MGMFLIIFKTNFFSYICHLSSKLFSFSYFPRFTIFSFIMAESEFKEKIFGIPVKYTYSHTWEAILGYLDEGDSRVKITAKTLNNNIKAYLGLDHLNLLKTLCVIDHTREIKDESEHDDAGGSTSLLTKSQKKKKKKRNE